MELHPKVDNETRREMLYPRCYVRHEAPRQWVAFLTGRLGDPDVVQRRLAFHQLYDALPDPGNLYPVVRADRKWERDCQTVWNEEALTPEEEDAMQQMRSLANAWLDRD